MNQPMPALFVGHGSPMNAISNNLFTKTWESVGKKLPKPKAILSISAHWETKGTWVTAHTFPPTIHDFGGFPKPLFEVQYPAPGDPSLAEKIRALVTKTEVKLDTSWGLDHGTWSVLVKMFPNADIPVLQLSMDATQKPAYHYELAKQLLPLREEGVLIFGTGNIVHSFAYADFRGGMDIPNAVPWALKANDEIKQYISNSNHSALVDYGNLSENIQLAVPTREHFLPLIFILALQTKEDKVSFFNDVVTGGSFSMTSVCLDKTDLTF